MNLAQMQKLLREKLARLKELRDLETRTSDQDTEARNLLGEAQTLKTDIERMEGEARTYDELLAFDNEPARRNAHANHQQEQGSRRESTNQRVGTDLVRVGGNGGYAIDHEGLGVSERAFKLACESNYTRAYWNSLLGRADTEDKRVLLEVNNELQKRAWDTGLIDTDGGYFAPPQFFAEIVGPDAYPTGLLDEVRTVPTTGKSIQMLRNTYTGSEIYNSPYRKDRTSGLSGPSSQTGPHLGELEIPIHESFIKVPVPRAMLEDSITAVQSYIVQQMRDAYRLGTEYELSLGTGVGQPQGILTDAGSTGEVGTFNTGSTPDAAKWVEFYREVAPMYRANAKLVISDDAYATVEKVQDANGAFPFAVLNLTNSAVVGAPVETYRGKPILFAPFYNAYSSTNKVASWGDHRRAYYYGLRMGAMMGIRNIADESYVTFVMRIRDGGKVVLPQALKVAVAS